MPRSTGSVTKLELCRCCKENSNNSYHQCTPDTNVKKPIYIKAVTTENITTKVKVTNRDKVNEENKITTDLKQINKLIYYPLMIYNFACTNRAFRFNLSDIENGKQTEHAENSTTHEKHINQAAKSKESYPSAVL